MKISMWALCALGVVSTEMHVASADTTATTGTVFLAQVPVEQAAAISKPVWKFRFAAGKATKDTYLVTTDQPYEIAIGYGFEPGANPVFSESGVTASTPFRFSAAVPEGNYRVTVVLGDKAAATNTSIKAEARRLVLESAEVEAGKTATKIFTVNVRTPQISGGSNVKLTGRESGPPLHLSWDEKLTLEVNGARPGLVSLDIVKVEDAPTVYIGGDSTVTDQVNEPYSGWGQMMPRFVKPNAAVANYAESGLTLGSFKGQNRLAKILSVVKPGEYVLLQFGHNDQKDKGENAGPFTSYKSNLKYYVSELRKKGALPVLVTPMERRRWTLAGEQQSTLTSYAEAVRQAGEEEQLPVIDLNVMSLKFYASLGPDGSKKAFVHYAPGSLPGLTATLRDDTHFNNYGAYELARCVVSGIQEKVPGLKALLADDVVSFDPSHPDALDKFVLPPSAYKVSEKPAGS